MKISIFDAVKAGLCTNGITEYMRKEGDRIVAHISHVPYRKDFYLMMRLSGCGSGNGRVTGNGFGDGSGCGFGDGSGYGRRLSLHFFCEPGDGSGDGNGSGNGHGLGAGKGVGRNWGDGYGVGVGSLFSYLKKGKH